MTRAQLPELAGELGAHHLLVEPGVVPERRHDDRGHVVAAALLDGPLHARDVVVPVVAEVGVVLRRDAGPPAAEPRHRAVVGAGRREDRGPPGRGAGHHQADRGGVGPVLCEDRPVRVRDAAGEQFRQLDHDRPRPGHGVAQGPLGGGRLLHLRVPVPEQDGPEAAHEVDVLVAVHVPHVRAVRALVELRVFGGQRVDAEVPVHAAGDDGPGPLAQGGVGRPDPALADDLGHGGSLLVLAAYPVIPRLPRTYHQVAIARGAT